MRTAVGRWCNGSTGVFEALSHGSNPCRPTNSSLAIPPLKGSSRFSDILNFARSFIDGKRPEGSATSDTDRMKKPAFSGGFVLSNEEIRSDRLT
jgi:hypothetical protein